MKYLDLNNVMRKLEPYGAKKKATINRFCGEKTIPAKWENEKWYVDSNYITNAILKRRHTKTLEEIEQEVIEHWKIEQGKEYQYHRSVLRFCHNEDYLLENDNELICFTGTFIKPESMEIVTKIAYEKGMSYSNSFKETNELLTLDQVAEALSISKYIVKQMILSNVIFAKKINQIWYISQSEITRYQKQHEEYCGIFDSVSIIADEINTVFDVNNTMDRGQLLKYIKKSPVKKYLVTREQVGIREDRKNSYYYPKFIEEKMIKVIREFLARYGTTEKRLGLLKNDKYWSTHPKTFEALEKFATNKKRIIGMVALYESIINSVKNEMVDCDNDEITNFIDYVSNAPTQIYTIYASKFINFLQSNYDCNFDIKIAYSQKVKQNIIVTDPYKISQYLAGGYMAFNEEFIRKNNSIEKAMFDSRQAFLWLYVCWHYIAAWRGIDLTLIPIIPLFHSNEEVFELIKKGEYEEEAIRVSLLLENEINQKHIKPTKTNDSQDTEFLIVHIPESLRSVIGTVYSICAIHNDFKSYKKVRFYNYEFIEFFGESYKVVFGNEPFLNRRANKSFMNVIAEITEKDSGNNNKVLGTVVASFIRSHKVGDGLLSQTTYKYLESKCDGYSVDEVLMLLWDNGMCSFIPYMLFDMVYGEAFTCLMLEEQSEIIKQSNITALIADDTTALVRNSYLQAKSMLDYFFKNFKNEDSKKLVAKNMLGNIIEKKAVGKEIGVNCLLAARQNPCKYPCRTSCVGCEMAILERSVFFLALEKIRSEYNNLQNAKTEGEKRKIKGLINSVYLPSMYDLLAFSKDYYKMNIESYRQELIEIIYTGELLAQQEETND